MAPRASQGSYPFREHRSVAELQATTPLERARAASVKARTSEREEGLAYAREWRARRAEEGAL
ncbi:hypothetical protein [Sphingomonas sp.]|uniref:hypothetical protein n=1 Tax=Sphingomonas sp. TaxID=28214 RepID=UPI00307F485E